MDLGRLQVIIPHDDYRKPAWLALVNEVAERIRYAAFMLNNRQKQNAEATGSHPLS
jgi:hypothetical protein